MKTAGSKTCAVLSKSVGLLGVREVEQRPLGTLPLAQGRPSAQTNAHAQSRVPRAGKKARGHAGLVGPSEGSTQGAGGHEWGTSDP